MSGKFKAALNELGIQCQVEEQGKLAVITLFPPAADPSQMLTVTRRWEIVTLARSHGFTTACLELRPVNAALSGD